MTEVKHCTGQESTENWLNTEKIKIMRVNAEKEKKKNHPSYTEWNILKRGYLKTYEDKLQTDRWKHNSDTKVTNRALIKHITNAKAINKSMCFEF